MVTMSCFIIFLELSPSELYFYLTLYDMKRLKMYSDKLVDYHLIMDMVPHLAKIYFTGKMPDVKLSIVQQVEYMGCG